MNDQVSQDAVQDQEQPRVVDPVNLASLADENARKLTASEQAEGETQPEELQGN